jgi:hypothetical protein
MNHRLTHYTEAGQLVSGLQVPYPISQLRNFSDGRFLALFPQPYGPTPSSVHILDDSGRYVSALVPQKFYADEMKNIILGDKVAAVDARGDVIVMNAASYQMSVMRDGKEIKKLSSTVDWFDGYKIDNKHIVGPGYGRVKDMSVDEQGRVWILMLLSSPTWKPKPSGRPDGRTPLKEMHHAWDTAIEVWDLNKGQLITGKVFDEYLTGFADENHVYTIVEDAEGDQHVRAWKLELSTSH